MDAEGRLVLWRPGLWVGGAPTLSCRTCRQRRADRMSADEPRPQGYQRNPCGRRSDIQQHPLGRHNGGSAALACSINFGMRCFSLFWSSHGLTEVASEGIKSGRKRSISVPAGARHCACAHGLGAWQVEMTIVKGEGGGYRSGRSCRRPPPVERL
ncbi:hypothetical protein EVAR_80454_1 [Eumeta japonica]|uniref:Uncharacterized protein n=1 Tax=Eumeta variegata TaxID=151549 RepID=A0A4C1VGC1_EUMVA|nr:hypothetical protein EVAR_80454_1 [Eumeta japonica]